MTMSVSPEFVDFSGQKAARMPEKSNFSQRCSLLSQSLKEKGSFGDLTLGMTCSNGANGNGTFEMLRPTTMNLFPMNEKQNDFLSRNTANPWSNMRSMDFFPQQAGFASPAPREDVRKRMDSNINKPAIPECPTAQMTIFYNGQVIVFDDLPADKAKEVMFLASQGSPQGHSAPGFHSLAVKNSPVFAPNVAESTTSIPSTSIVVPPTIRSDLPIARRASLHRFLEKRKDRITARAPYQLGGATATSSKPNETKSWLGLAAQPSQ